MKKIILFVVGLLILAAIPITVFLVGQQQELRKKAAPATTLSFVPATITTKVGETFSLDVQINASDNQILATELHIAFDPEVIEAQTITNSPQFPSILEPGVVDQGTASISVGTTPQTPFKGEGSIATIRFKAMKESSSPISIRFADNTFVGDPAEGANNALVGSTPATITILGDTTPTISPTPTPVPEASNEEESSASGILILGPTNNESVSTGKPIISGKASPGSTITITIYSTPQTAVVTADENGNWSYTPETALESGPHSIVASAQTGSGSQTATSAFVVASESAIPVSGSVTTTVLLLLIGTLLIVAGMITPFFL